MGGPSNPWPILTCPVGVPSCRPWSGSGPCWPVWSREAGWADHRPRGPAMQKLGRPAFGLEGGIGPARRREVRNRFWERNGVRIRPLGPPCGAAGAGSVAPMVSGARDKHFSFSSLISTLNALQSYDPSFRPQSRREGRIASWSRSCSTWRSAKPDVNAISNREPAPCIPNRVPS